MAKKTGLGSSPLNLEWIKDTTVDEDLSFIRNLSIEQIVESERFKLRIDLPNMDTLIEDIRQKGQTTPVFVRQNQNEMYELISGYRRFQALKHLEKKTILARVFTGLSDEESEQLAISENVQRKDLTDLEQARICVMLQEQGLIVKKIAEVVGKKERTIFIYLAVAKAPEEICNPLHQGKISLYIAHELAEACKRELTAHICSRSEDLADLVSYVIEQELSVRQLKKHLNQLEADKTETNKPINKRKRGSFQPVRYADKRDGFDLVIKFRRKEDANSIIKVLEEALDRVRKGLSDQE